MQKKPKTEFFAFHFFAFRNARLLLAHPTKARAFSTSLVHSREMQLGRLIAAARTGSAAVRAFGPSARASNRRRHWATAAASASTTEEEEQQPQQQDTLRATLRDLPGPVASALADELLLCGAFSASVDEFRPPGAAEQRIFGARGRDGGDNGDGEKERSEGGSFPSPSDSAAVFWDRCTLTAIFDKDADVSSALREASLLAGVDSLTLPEVEFSEARAAEWLESLRGAFSPVFIDSKEDRDGGGKGGRGLWILPEGCSLPQHEEGEASLSTSASSSASSDSASSPVVVRLTPGLAFGTGDHPTTRMCLRWLATEEVTAALNARGGGGGAEEGGGAGGGSGGGELGASLLDFGTGSGVLVAAAIALGCRSAVGTDVDPLALTAAAENAALNAPQITSTAATSTAAAETAVATSSALLRTVLVSPDPPPPRGENSSDDPVGPPGCFDVVVANILQGPLIKLAPDLSSYAKPGAALAVSGVLASQAKDVAAAFEAVGVYLKEFDRERCGGGGEGEEGWWVCLSGQKRL